MTNVRNQRVLLGQANGPEVELVVNGTALYATYETPDGYPALYDDDRGLYCFAKVIDGRYVSTHVPVTDPVPADVARHAKESDAVRQEKAAARAQARTPTTSRKDGGT